MASNGSLVRPESPTRKCDEISSDCYLLEKCLAEPIEQLQSSRNEIVCALSSKAMFKTKKGDIIPDVGVSFYFCAFCQFNSDDKQKLLDHIVCHRFICKYCEFQAFSRTDIVRHSVTGHKKQFEHLAKEIKFCCLLPDFLSLIKAVKVENKRKNVSKERDEESGEDADAVNDGEDKVPKPQPKTSTSKKRKHSPEPVPKKSDSSNKKSPEVPERTSPRMHLKQTVSPSENGSVSQPHYDSSDERKPANSISSLMAYRPAFLLSSSKFLAGSSHSTSGSAPIIETTSLDSGKPRIIWGCCHCDFQTTKINFLTEHVETKHASVMIDGKIGKTDLLRTLITSARLKEIKIQDSIIAAQKNSREAEQKTVTVTPPEVKPPESELDSDGEMLMCLYCEYSSEIVSEVRAHTIATHKNSVIGARVQGKAFPLNIVYICPHPGCLDLKWAQCGSFLQHFRECFSKVSTREVPSANVPGYVETKEFLDKLTENKLSSADLTLESLLSAIDRLSCQRGTVPTLPGTPQP